MKNKYFLIATTMFFSVLSFAQVGINTTTPDAETKLDVNGDVIVRHPDTNVDTNVTQLYRRRDDGRVLLAESTAKRSIYIVGLKITIPKDGDKPIYNIDSYNTGLYTDQYYVSVLDATLMDATTGIPAFTSHHNGWGYDEVNPLKQASMIKREVKGFDGSSVWCVQANFSGNYGGSRKSHKITLANSTHDFYWLFRLLVIDKKFVREVDANKQDNNNELYQLNEEGVGSVKSEFIIDHSVDNTTPVLDSNFDEKNKFVGIGTNDPKASLDVNGNINIKTVANTSDRRYTYPLLVNTKTHRMVAFQPEEKRKPFVFLSGEFAIKDIKQDYIKDVNTNILVDKYVLIPTNVFLGNKYFDNRKEGDETVFGTAHYKSGYYQAFNGQQRIWVNNEAHDENDNITYGQKTWHFGADYADVNPVCGNLDKNHKLINADKCDNLYYWNADFLAISNTYAISLGTFEDSVVGFVDSDKNVVKDQPNIPRGDTDIVKYLLHEKESK